MSNKRRTDLAAEIVVRPIRRQNGRFSYLQLNRAAHAHDGGHDELLVGEQVNRRAQAIKKLNFLADAAETPKVGPQQDA